MASRVKGWGAEGEWEEGVLCRLTSTMPYSPHPAPISRAKCTSCSIVSLFTLDEMQGATLPAQTGLAGNAMHLKAGGEGEEDEEEAGGKVKRGLREGVLGEEKRERRRSRW